MGLDVGGESCSLSRLSPTPPSTSSQFMKPTTHRNELHSMPPPCSMCRGRARTYAQDTTDHSRCMYICFSLASKLSILGGETDDTLSLCSGFLFLRWLSACTYACIHTCAAANCEEAFCEFMYVWTGLTKPGLIILKYDCMKSHLKISSDVIIWA